MCVYMLYMVERKIRETQERQVRREEEMKGEECLHGSGKNQLIPHANHVLQGSKTPCAHIMITIANTSCLIHKPLDNELTREIPCQR